VRLFNTLSRQQEPFTVNGGMVGIYCCGVTPYDTTHLGHAFTYLTFDVLVRYLRIRGNRVRYVQNVTDIDDDILIRSAKVGMAWDQLAREQTMLYLQDMAALNILAPDVFPKASEECAMIIEITTALLEKGLAYERNGSVYYRTGRDEHYGDLPNLPFGDLLPIANERGNFPDDPNKEYPLDFPLWQAKRPGEPSWASPWGDGRPGWHIECSAMSMRYLGKQVDIHGGGSDLIFPHHASETAQSEPYTGVRPFVRYWMHVGMVEYDGEKMSKSLGNLVLVRNVLREYNSDALRLCLLNHHYREAWQFVESELAPAAALASRLSTALGRTRGDPTVAAKQASRHQERFFNALDDDLNAPAAVGVLVDIASDLEAGRAERPDDWRADLYRLGSMVLGLRFPRGA
jgi:L-cysteine:1D-myo-inositol 2-amino-2-deoxy-alpha-D-glucopyranoside ligase